MSGPIGDEAAYRGENGYRPAGVMIIACSALAIYNALELLVLIYSTFKKREGLYFWSILLASFGAIPYAVGLLIEHFGLTQHWVGMLIDGAGWVLLVTGQSVVLYSRLHLVLRHPLALRLVFWMIVANGVIWHITMTVLIFGSRYAPEPNRANCTAAFYILEKVQMSFFCVQEFIISGLYIWGTTDILKTALGSTRRYMWHLFIINVIIVAMDIGLLVVEYIGLWKWQQGIKVVIYTVKLKLEFAVLGELVDFVRRQGGAGSGENPNSAAFVEIPAHWAQRPGKKPQSIHGPEVIHMEHVNQDTDEPPVTTKTWPNPTRRRSHTSPTRL